MAISKILDQKSPPEKAHLAKFRKHVQKIIHLIMTLTMNQSMIVTMISTISLEMVKTLKMNRAYRFEDKISVISLKSSMNMVW